MALDPETKTKIVVLTKQLADNWPGAVPAEAELRAFAIKYYASHIGPGTQDLNGEVYHSRVEELLYADKENLQKKFDAFKAEPNINFILSNGQPEQSADPGGSLPTTTPGVPALRPNSEIEILPPEAEIPNTGAGLTANGHGLTIDADFDDVTPKTETPMIGLSGKIKKSSNDATPKKSTTDTKSGLENYGDLTPMFSMHREHALAGLKAGHLNQFRDLNDFQAFLMLNVHRRLDQDPETIAAVFEEIKRQKRAELLKQDGINEGNVDQHLSALDNTKLWNDFINNTENDPLKFAILQQNHSLFSGLKHETPHAINEIKFDAKRGQFIYRDLKGKEYHSDGRSVMMKPPRNGHPDAAAFWDNAISIYMSEHDLVSSKGQIRSIEFNLHTGRGLFHTVKELATDTKSERFQLGALSVLHRSAENNIEPEIALGKQRPDGKNIVKFLDIQPGDRAFEQYAQLMRDEWSVKGNAPSDKSAEELLEEYIDTYNNRHEGLNMRNAARVNAEERPDNGNTDTAADHLAASSARPAPGDVPIAPRTANPSTLHRERDVPAGTPDAVAIAARVRSSGSGPARRPAN